MSQELFRPHQCQLGHPDRSGILQLCECGRLWRSVAPGNPLYAGWRRVGPIRRWLYRKLGKLA